MRKLTDEERAKCLQALYSNSCVMGMGHFDPNANKPLKLEDALALVKRDLLLGDKDNGVYFDYLRGRPLKVRIPYQLESFDFRSYDRDNGGPGTGEALVRQVLTEPAKTP